MNRRRPRTEIARKAKKESSTRLPYHREGPGVRWVFFDSRHTPGAGLYAIVRTVSGLRKPPESYVDEHAHSVPSYYLFVGDSTDLSGLVAEVRIGGRRRQVRSPYGVFIPREIQHYVRIVRGSGLFVHILLEENFRKSVRKCNAKNQRKKW